MSILAINLKFRKRPVTIEAFQMLKERARDKSDWPNWLIEASQKTPGDPGCLFYDKTAPGPTQLFMIATLEGVHRVDWNDWIIQGVQGELYPCKPVIFELTYEAVDDVGLSVEST